MSPRPVPAPPARGARHELASCGRCGIWHCAACGCAPRRLIRLSRVWFWQWLVHVTGADYGIGYGRWNFYGFFSGFGSDLGEVTIIAGLLAVCRRHNCHVRGCWRIGRHQFADPETGAVYMLCRRHHPAVPGKGLRADHASLARARGQGPGEGGAR